MNFRTSASFGKRQEFIAVAELLKRGFDVYMTLVDDQQIDCVIRLEADPPHYVDVQIKARSAKAVQCGTFAAMEIRKPRDNFFFIFYSEAANCYWVMPSKDVIAKAYCNKEGKNAGKYSLVLAMRHPSGARPRPKWDAYKNNFDLLRKALHTGGATKD